MNYRQFKHVKEISGALICAHMKHLWGDRNYIIKAQPQVLVIAIS